MESRVLNQYALLALLRRKEMVFDEMGVEREKQKGRREGSGVCVINVKSINNSVEDDKCWLWCLIIVFYCYCGA